MLPCDQFLRIAELEALRENFGVAHLAEARQARPDLRRDRIIPVTMPTQDQLGLLPEVFEVRHGRATVDIALSGQCVGGHCPFGLKPMRPTCSAGSMAEVPDICQYPWGHHIRNTTKGAAPYTGSPGDLRAMPSNASSSFSRHAWTES